MAVLDKVKVKTSDKEFTGILMPDSINKKLVLKLDTGYNIGIDKKKIKSIKVLKKNRMKKSVSKKVKQNSKLPKISILHTGGTIASKVDYETGGVIAKFKPEELLDMVPELKKIGNFSSKMISNVMSEDMTFKNYNVMAKEIEKEVKKGVKGIIITHGTDTMHYTSAALSFMLEDLSIPIVLVGSQRSSDRGSSDAYLNLVCAAQFIAKTDYSGVCICMHKDMNDYSCLILPGVKTRKLHTSRRDAFKVVNDLPIVEIDNNGKIIDGNSKFDSFSKKLKVKLFKDLKIGVLKAHPNMSVKEVSCYSSFDGLIVEGLGIGHFPIHNSNKKIFEELKKLSKKIPIVLTSQTIFGRVNMNVYSTGRDLQKFLISGEDMLTEVAFVKMAYLLSNYKKHVKEMMIKDLRGEINPRIDDEFL
jgi:glutamyl-tRNA(Gln) amidotransferase subunit D